MEDGRDFIDRFKSQSGTPHTNDVHRLREILNRMRWDHIFSFVKRRKGTEPSR